MTDAEIRSLVKKKVYECTNTEHGKTYLMTHAKAVSSFGKNELPEYLGGYDPVWVVVQLNEQEFVAALARGEEFHQ